jgi:hypothetical protein
MNNIHNLIEINLSLSKPNMSSIKQFRNHSCDSITISTEVVQERYARNADGICMRTPEALCVVCNESSHTSEGLYCSDSKHYQCDECITNWTKTLNEQRVDAPDMLRQREGLFLCVQFGCTSKPFKASAVFSHLLDEQVSEEFLECLTHTHTLRVQEHYQQELSRQLAEVRGAGGEAADEGGESAETRAKKVELEALAANLRLTLRQPRMCRQCQYGPVENPFCDDLQCHHGDTMQEGQPMVKNSCPRCGWFDAEWSQWLPWDGNLPTELREGVDIAPAQRVPTRPCRFFARGYCLHGDECTFLHVEAEVTPPVVAAMVADLRPREQRPREDRAREDLAERIRMARARAGVAGAGAGAAPRDPRGPRDARFGFAMAASRAPRGLDSRPDCTNFVRDGFCRYGFRCRFAHPPGI